MTNEDILKTIEKESEYIITIEEDNLSDDQDVIILEDQLGPCPSPDSDYEKDPDLKVGKDISLLENIRWYHVLILILAITIIIVFVNEYYFGWW